MKRFKHSLSHYHLTTAEMGKLYPVGHYEVLPGDTCQQNTSALIRLSPPVRPVMHPVVVRFHTWYVPYRLLWTDWEKFITGGPDPEGSPAGAFPYIQGHATNGFTAKTLPDYFGVKPGTAGANMQISALPIRAYNKIWNERYRDQDLQSRLTVPLTSGADSTSPLDVQSVSWEKDRFTEARPWPQKGADVLLPLGDTAPIILDPARVDGTASKIRNATGGALAGAGLTLTTDASGNLEASSQDRFVDLNATHVADLSDATSATVNELREAMALQRYQEARALYGSEYIDYLRYLGIRPSDARFQQPEYLGGSKQTITWSEIVQTSKPEAGDPLGQLGGHGLSAMRTRPYRFFVEEHGIVMTLMSVRPRSMYPDGLPRMWSRRTKEDFWQKELEHIGQEPVYSRELWAESDANGGSDIFGYADRYSDYREKMSYVSAEFRDSTMNDWHMARRFSSAPTLNSAFVTCDPTDRIFADQTANADHLWCMVNHRIGVRRMVSRGGKPGMIR